MEITNNTEYFAAKAVREDLESRVLDHDGKTRKEFYETDTIAQYFELSEALKRYEDGDHE